MNAGQVVGANVVGLAISCSVAQSIASWLPA